MDDKQFDALSRLIDGIGTRRLALGAALAGIAALGLTAPGSEIDAKKKKKKCKKCKALAADAPCNTNKECCTNETNRACAVAENASNSDTTCCGALDAPCGGRSTEDAPSESPFCCADYVCSTEAGTPGVCQPDLVMI